jgi:DNA replicative helicase MCM subunit Mcm2 (Cdc46/Mcm family)
MAELDETLEKFIAEDYGTIDEELDEKFAVLVESEDMLDYWASRINPKVVGMMDEKRATMLCLASHSDLCGDRGRLHLLLYGDPGTAKTLITDWVVFKLGAVGASMRSSQVGLTADASGNEITLGALPRANDGIICIDEIEKFDQKSLQGLLEALEEGRIHIDVGKTHTVIDARVRCIACANETKKLSRELMDRFDFKIEVHKPELDFKRKIMRSRIKYWFKEKDGYDGINLKTYLRWIKDYKPSITEAVRDKWIKIMELYLVLTESDGSIREEESMIRIAVTIAKMHHRDAIPGDILRGIRLRHPDLNGGKMELLEKMLREE